MPAGVCSGLFSGLGSERLPHFRAIFAEYLFVSDKTVSKLKHSVCMPDYSILEPLCRRLSVLIGAGIIFFLIYRPYLPTFSSPSGF